MEPKNTSCISKLAISEVQDSCESSLSTRNSEAWFAAQATDFVQLCGS